LVIVSVFGVDALALVSVLMLFSGISQQCQLTARFFYSLCTQKSAWLV